jgi:hypothetical protein
MVWLRCHRPSQLAGPGPDDDDRPAGPGIRVRIQRSAAGAGTRMRHYDLDSAREIGYTNAAQPRLTGMLCCSQAGTELEWPGGPVAVRCAGAGGQARAAAGGGRGPGGVVAAQAELPLMASFMIIRVRVGSTCHCRDDIPSPSQDQSPIVSLARTPGWAAGQPPGPPRSGSGCRRTRGPGQAPPGPKMTRTASHGGVHIRVDLHWQAADGLALDTT